MRKEKLNKIRKNLFLKFRKLLRYHRFQTNKNKVLNASEKLTMKLGSFLEYFIINDVDQINWRINNRDLDYEKLKEIYELFQDYKEILREKEYKIIVDKMPLDEKTYQKKKEIENMILNTVSNEYYRYYFDKVYNKDYS